MDDRIDGNGRDGGERREDIPLTYSPSFHFFYFSLFLSFSPSFFVASHECYRDAIFVLQRKLGGRRGEEGDDLVFLG